MTTAERTILVTGGCGYLGSQLIRDLAGTSESLIIRVLDNFQSGNYQSLMNLPGNKGFQFVQGDILDPATIRYALQEVNTVIHLAAIVTTPMGFGYDPIWVEQVNHWGTARLIETCLAADVPRFIFASSAAVYGPGGPFTEKDLCRPVGPYAQSKHRAEQSVQTANERGLQATILRFGTLFGYAPGIRFTSVANRFAFLAGVGKALTVYGSGRQRRPLVHVRDASAAIQFCLQHPKETARRVLNVVGENASVLDLVHAVQYSCPAIPVRYAEQDVLTHFSFEVDGSAIAAVGPGWHPQIGIESGLAELLARFENFQTFSVPSMNLDPRELV